MKQCWDLFGQQCCVRLHILSRLFYFSFISSNVGELFESEFFYRNVSKFRKRRRMLASCHVLHKKWQKVFLCRSRVAATKKCTEKHDARAKSLFCISNLLLFCRSRCRRWLPNANCAALFAEASPQTSCGVGFSSSRIHFSPWGEMNVWPHRTSAGRLYSLWNLRNYL